MIPPDVGVSVWVRWLDLEPIPEEPVTDLALEDYEPVPEPVEDLILEEY